MHQKQFIVPIRGYLYVILASVLWGFSSPAMKFLFNKGMPPFTVALMKTGLAFPIIYVLLRKLDKDLIRFPRDNFLAFLMFGVAFSLIQILFLFTISKISVAVGTLLCFSGVILIFIYSVIFFGEKLSFGKVMSVSLAVFGCYLSVGAYNIELFNMNKIGILSGILLPFCYAFHIIVGEKALKSAHPWTLLLYGSVISTFVFAIISIPWRASLLTLDFIEIMIIIFVVIFGTILPFFFLLNGVKYIRSTRASITHTIEPIIAGVISAIFLKEYLSLLQMMGGTIIIASIVILQIEKERESRRITSETVQEQRSKP